MKALVIGCGNIGSVAADDLATNMKPVKITLADYDKARAQAAAEKIGKKNVSWIQLDIKNRTQLWNSLKDFNVIMGFLPGDLGYSLTEACIGAKKDLVDVSFMAEDPLTLNDQAVKAGITVVPDCGLAPGISNVLVGHAAAELDRVQTVHIMVGGLPEKSVPPLGYVITWAPESLIDEYTRKARVVKNGKAAEAEVLSGLEEVDFPNFGKLEAFLTDGLRTLIQTIDGAEEMWEKTLRYPGHAEKIRVLKNLGFFEDRQVNVGGTNVSPRKLTVKLFEEKLRKPEVKDIVALKVDVSGVKNGKPARYIYHLLDYFDRKHGTTAMARTTAYPASILAQLMLKGAVKEKGVVPPERIGMNHGLFKSFLEELRKRKIEIREEIVTG